MGIKESIQKWLGIEERTVLSSDSSGMTEIFGITESSTGINVSEESSLRLSAVYACVRIISESIASLPLKLYRYGPENEKQIANNHPLYKILHDISNSEQSAFEFIETSVVHLNLWGNAYIKKVINNKGQITKLTSVSPWNVNLMYDLSRPVGFQKIYYITEDTGEQKAYFQNEILHIRGLSLNGKVGLSPIAYAREAIGLGLAAEQFGSKYFGNGTNIGATLEHPGTLSDEAYKRLKSDMAVNHQGVANSNKLMILEEGMKHTKSVIPPEDSQFIETRKFQLNEIARIFRVPPHMIADLEKATFSNIEHQSIEFVMHTLRPWLVRIEQAIFMQVLTENERQKYFVNFNVDALLRGDVKSRYEAYHIALQDGWLNRDEVRAKEKLNPIPEGKGKEFFMNGNMVPIDFKPEGGENNEKDNNSNNGAEGNNK